jgi:hypothetical protein
MGRRLTETFDTTAIYSEAEYPKAISWQRSFDTGAAGHAPRVVLRASHEGALAYCSLDDLKRFAIDLA